MGVTKNIIVDKMILSHKYDIIHFLEVLILNQNKNVSRVMKPSTFFNNFFPVDFLSNTSGDPLPLPDDMQFNTANVISIVGYSFLFVVSSIANLVRVNHRDFSTHT